MNQSQKDALCEYITQNIIDNEEGLITPVMVRSLFSKELSDAENDIDGIVDFFDEGALIVVESEEDLPRIELSEDNDPDRNKLYYCELEESFWLYDAEEGDIVKLNIGSRLMVNVKYAELKAMRDHGELKPGCCYRITDYVTKVRNDEDGYFRSEEHPFDVIVLALDEKTLSEDAKAVRCGEELRHTTTVGYEIDDTQEDVSLSGVLEGYATDETKNIEGTDYYVFRVTENRCDMYESGSLVDSGYLPFASDEYDDAYAGKKFYAASTAPQNADAIFVWEDTETLVTLTQFLSDAGLQAQAVVTITNDDELYTDHYFDECELGAWELKYTLDHPKEYEHAPVDTEKILSVTANVCTSWHQQSGTKYTEGTNSRIRFDQPTENPVAGWGSWYEDFVAFKVPDGTSVYASYDMSQPSQPRWKGIEKIDVVLLDISYETPYLYGYSYAMNDISYYITYDTDNPTWWLECEVSPSDVESVTIPSDGKGFIKYMKDEHGNACDYDFKNVTYIDPYGTMTMNRFSTFGNVLTGNEGNYSMSEPQNITWQPVGGDPDDPSPKSQKETTVGNEEEREKEKGEIKIQGTYTPYVDGKTVRLVDAKSGDIFDRVICDFYGKTKTTVKPLTRGVENMTRGGTGSEPMTPQTHHFTKNEILVHYLSHRHEMIETDNDGGKTAKRASAPFNFLNNGKDAPAKKEEMSAKIMREVNTDTMRLKNGRLVNAGYDHADKMKCTVDMPSQTKNAIMPMDSTSRAFDYGYLYVYTYSHYVENTATDLTVWAQDMLDRYHINITGNTIHSFEYYESDSYPGAETIYLPATYFLICYDFETIKNNEIGPLFADFLLEGSVSIEDSVLRGVPWDEDYDDWAYEVYMEDATIAGCMFNDYNLIPYYFYDDTYCIQGEYYYLAHRPELADVAYSGSYSDLSDRPTIGNGQVTLKDSNDNVLGSFTMNQNTDTNIEITTSDDVFCTQEEFDLWEQQGLLDENKTYFIEGALADIAKSGKASDIVSDVEFVVSKTGSTINSVTCDAALADIPDDGYATVTISDSGNDVTVRGVYNKETDTVVLHINNTIAGIQFMKFTCGTTGSTEVWDYETTYAVTSVGGYSIVYISAADYAQLNPPSSDVIYLIH